jgi:hypothetical protein
MAKKGTTARGGGGTGKARRGGSAGQKGSKASAVKARGSKTAGRASTRARPGARSAAGGKVGSSSVKAGQFAGRRDFGVPASRATPSGRAPDSAVGLPRNEEGRSGAAGDRTHGVGSAPSNVGSGSGGDLDTDFVGVGTGPVSQEGPDGAVDGPDAATDPSGDFASAPDRPARGRNQKGHIEPGAHGAAGTRTFDTVDHTGEDANTVQGGTNADTADVATRAPAPKQGGRP